MKYNHNLYTEIQNIKNLSKEELGSKKREIMYQDLVYQQFLEINSDEFEYRKGGYYKNIIYEKKKYNKSNNVFKLGITDFDDKYKNKNGVIELKFGIYSSPAKLNHALIQTLSYGIYIHKDYYVLMDIRELKIIFYDENKKAIKRFHNRFRSKLCEKSPRVLGETNNYDFSQFKIHTIAITPDFTLDCYQNFIKNHYE